MTRGEVEQIARKRWLPHQTEEVELVETHISWVLMADHYVYKLKKPLKLNFLDFSTLENRKKACQQEVELNRRLAPEMYLGVLPVTREGKRLQIGEGSGEVLDYAVWMRRMDEHRQMDLLIEQDLVSQAQVRELAEVVAGFHLKAKKVVASENWKQLYEEFADISSVQSIVTAAFGRETGVFLDEALQGTRQFLSRMRSRIEERKTRGFIVDGHGDLHCRNIFLLDPPVIFDCIEFSVALRTLDMLNEAAFLCMDLERFGRADLARSFITHYNSLTGVIENDADRHLFVYYKMYRANVRLKVQCLELKGSRFPKKEKERKLELLWPYLRLFRTYYEDLKSGGA